MPWEETSKMDERMKFIYRLKEGEKMKHLCAEFGISRQTGYNLLKRYNQKDGDWLKDKRRCPLRKAHLTNPQIEKLILELKEEKPHWGAAKIREIFIRRYSDIRPPVRSTFHAIFVRNDLVKKRRRRGYGYKAKGTWLSKPKSPNDLWCADFKGEFLLSGQRPRRYCYPLTINDSVSRYLLSCEALEDVKARGVFPVFERVFEEHGLPLAIRTDNGCPFSSPLGLFGLSRLSVWWLRLGIKIEKIRPGHPEENGRLERVHRTIKSETTKPAGDNFLQQQEKFDNFISEYNKERPHEGLGMKTPSEVYKSSNRQYRGLREVEYPFHEKEKRISGCGQLSFAHNKKVFISRVLAEQPVGLSEVDDGIWKVSFMDYDIGYFDEESLKFTPEENAIFEKRSNEDAN